MDARERLLTAMNNGKADHLPAQVHSWMAYYLENYLAGVDQYAAYERFGLDAVIYVNPRFEYDEGELANWRVETTDFGVDEDGNRRFRDVITTPEGTLTVERATNQYTCWTTKYPIQTEEDFEIWDKFVPVPTRVDWGPVIEAKNRIGSAGIVRGGFFGFGQGSPWQDLCTMMDTQEAILNTFDKPDFIHHCLESLLAKKLRVIERAGRFELDLVECGGGAGSNTIISPEIHKKFCLPYDKRQIEAFHAGGTKVVYHLCGGLMQLLEIVVENGTDGLETMTPPSMGGDCDLAEATRRVGDKLFFIGGFDQNQGFERGSVENVREQVFALHAACPDGGYICSPSDHFFHGDPQYVQAFADAAKECVYG